MDLDSYVRLASRKIVCSLTRGKNIGISRGVGVGFGFGSIWEARAYARELVFVVDVEGVHTVDVSVPAWKGPVCVVASMCQHLIGERHRVAVLDLEGLVSALVGYTHGEPVPLGGIRVGSFGIVLQGFAAVDVLAVHRNVVWEDEHCLSCCGAMLRFVEPLQHKVLVRCGPTIGARSDESGSVLDEYWTD